VREPFLPKMQIPENCDNIVGFCEFVMICGLLTILVAYNVENKILLLVVKFEDTVRVLNIWQLK